jgi:hypothetical protein
MKFTGILAAAAMIAGTIAPAAAAPVAAPTAASKLSVTRAATPTVGASKIAGEGPFLSLLIAAAAIGGLLALNSALGDEDQADSN